MTNNVDGKDLEKLVTALLCHHKVAEVPITRFKAHVLKTVHFPVHTEFHTSTFHRN